MSTITVIVNSGSSGPGLTPTVVVAIIAALSAITFSYQTHRRERNRDRTAEKARLQEQASKFAFWIYEDETRRVIMCKNSSDLPIENVTFIGWNPIPPLKTLEDAIDTAVDTAHIQVVPPGENERADMIKSSTLQQTSVIFTDQQGVLWARHAGRLAPNPLATDQQPAWYQAYEWEPLSFIQSVFSDFGTSVRYLKDWMVEVLAVMGSALGFKKKK